MIDKLLTFSAHTLAFFRKELEEFVLNDGKIRLIIGEPLGPEEYAAVLEGHRRRALEEAVNKTVHTAIEAARQ